VCNVVGLMPSWLTGRVIVGKFYEVSEECNVIRQG
jgi:hypothetical protein